MLKIQENFDLIDKTTWHIPTLARGYILISSVDDLKKLVRNGHLHKYKKYHLLGSGANSLFADKLYDGLVIEIDLKGKSKIEESDKYEIWRLMAGEDWEEIVEYFANANLGGIENLALIPGKVGAAPVQNIAAYGTAFEEVCESVNVFDIETGEEKVYEGPECHFGYRTSKFKVDKANGLNNEIITSVTLRLTKAEYYDINTSYYSISEKLSDIVAEISHKNKIQKAFDAVVHIRRGKLPDHKSIGTNGSVFMNPVVSGAKLKELLKTFPKLQFYPVDKMQYLVGVENIDMSKNYKIAAAHIFDELGWKGKRVGNVGTWEKQAIVLCNYGASDPKEILDVVKMMSDDFERATGIMLKPEINIIK